MYSILAFGDSITFGEGEMPTKGWVGRLKGYFEPQGERYLVHNLGVPGQGVKEVLERFDTECKARMRHKYPDDRCAIIITIGANDSRWDGRVSDNKPRTSDKDFEQGVRKLLQKAKAYKAGLVCISIAPVDEKKSLDFNGTAFTNARIKMLNTILEQCCAEQHVPFLDLFSLLLKPGHETLFADGVHPNAKGYDAMFKHIKTFLKENKIIE